MKNSLLTFEESDHSDNIIEALRDYEAEEVAVVALANAIIYPGAVMIKPFHALLAVDAMEAPRCLDQMAICANMFRVHRPHNSDIVHLRVSLEVAWVFATSDSPEHKTHNVKDLARVEDKVIRAIGAAFFFVLIRCRVLIKVA